MRSDDSGYNSKNTRLLEASRYAEDERRTAANDDALRPIGQFLTKIVVGVIVSVIAGFILWKITGK
jgi:hypothetical protein